MNCEKCNGTGYLPQYSHIDNGICYNCNSDGHIKSDNKTTQIWDVYNYMMQSIGSKNMPEHPNFIFQSMGASFERIFKIKPSVCDLFDNPLKGDLVENVSNPSQHTITLNSIVKGYIYVIERISKNELKFYFKKN